MRIQKKEEQDKKEKYQDKFFWRGKEADDGYKREINKIYTEPAIDNVVKARGLQLLKVEQ